MFDKFCRDNRIGPVTKAAFWFWITKNRYGYEDEQDLDMLWSGYLEEEREGIEKALSNLRGKEQR